MRGPDVFRRQLAARILGVVGTMSIASCSGGGKAANGTAGSSGAATTGSSSATSTGATGTSTTASGTTASSTSGTSTAATTSGAMDGGTGAGTGGAGGASCVGPVGSGGAGGSNPDPPIEECFDPSVLADAGVDAGVNGGVCPADPTVVLADFEALHCPFGWEPFQFVAGPLCTDAGSQCCYMVVNHLCTGTGRPYLVEGRARVAGARRGAGSHGWTDGGSPSLTALAPGDRAALAAAWTRDALMEHASVASFARFSLALLAVGAPADLVELANRAALDEVRHARLCFALASAYAGEDIAPGPFPIAGAQPVSLVALAIDTVAEGCIGETTAAVIAAEQLARAKDTAVQAALAEIVVDEARHAELAWRTVAWALRVGGDDVRAAVEQAFVEALIARRATPTMKATVSPAMEVHGRLDPSVEARVSASVMASVVIPAARALIGVPAIADS
jgi:hypothetical protein